MMKYSVIFICAVTSTFIMSLVKTHNRGSREY